MRWLGSSDRHGFVEFYARRGLEGTAMAGRSCGQQFSCDVFPVLSVQFDRMPAKRIGAWAPCSFTVCPICLTRRRVLRFGPGLRAAKTSAYLSPRGGEKVAAA